MIRVMNKELSKNMNRTIRRKYQASEDLSQRINRLNDRMDKFDEKIRLQDDRIRNIKREFDEQSRRLDEVTYISELTNLKIDNLENRTVLDLLRIT
jgi:methyl-accepting chemotaxis protein